MKLNYLKKTLMLCLKYHKANGNIEKQKELQSRIDNLKKK